ncbi:MAG: hypothetical protein Q7S20_00040 [Gemmatimonadaceae bacterium]|nr:hypothetical protein [Gemmatimonadaceae bacterium]
MPAEEALIRQRLLVPLRCVEHHLHDTLDVTVRWLQPADIDSKPARDGRAHLVGVQLLALDFAALQHVFGQRAKNRLLSDLEAQGLHRSEQTPLQVPGCRQGSRQPPVVPAELRPVWKVMDICRHSPLALRRL